MGFIFSSLTKKFRRLGKDIAKDTIQELEVIGKQFDHIAQERITHARVEAESLETKIVDDIKKIVATTDQSIQKQVQEINRIRQETIQDLDKLLTKTDHYTENRINQLSLAWMEAVTKTESSLSQLETQIFQDVNYVIDRLEVLIDKTLDQVRNELKKNIGYAIPSPFDPCRRQLNLCFKPGALLSDIELYRLSECCELRKLNEETPVEKIREVYGQLELNAARMAALTKNASGLRKLAIEDWLKYGMLCEFWCTVAKRYDSIDLQQLQIESRSNILLKQE